MINVGTVTQSVSTTVGKKPKGNILSGSRPMSDIPDNVPVGLTPEERAEIFYQMDAKQRPDLSSLPKEDLEAIKLRAHEMDALEAEIAGAARRQGEMNLRRAQAAGRGRQGRRSASAAKTKPAEKKLPIVAQASEIDSSYAEMIEVFDDEGNSFFTQSAKNVDPGPGLPFDDSGLFFDDLIGEIRATVAGAAQTGKQAAANVVKNAPRSTASLSNSAANTVAQSIIRNKDLKMNALMLGLGGAGVGYGYARNKRPRR